ncbi:MAG: PBP1A family penicillin-binding protein [Spirochaetes bacterium]|nr:PBP1A family penicillin-binding protein [Spirochaetota bacterium]
MFKKYNGFDSRFKRPNKNEKSPDTIKTERKDPKDNKTKLSSSLKLPDIHSRKESDNKKKTTIAGFNIKKKFSFPVNLSGSFNLSLIFSNAGSFVKNKILIYKSILIGISFGLVITLIIFCISTIITNYKKVIALADFQPNITTNIYDKNGLLVSELFRHKREVVPLSKMPPVLIDAFIALEDNEFYDHYGLNIKGIVRAFFINVFSGRIKQGGSTITMQLAKILLTTADKSYLRKIKDIIIALMIEVAYSKNEILELYLNQIFLGHGVYGVESASSLYFSKHVWQINLAEAALLASLPSAPNKLSPIRHTKRSIERHRIALAKMADCGFVNIPEAEKAYLGFWPDYLAYINDLPPSITSWSSKIDKAPWFTEYIRRKLVNQFGAETVYKDGLSVYTTLDLKKQLAAQKQIQEGMDRQAAVSGNLSFKNEDYIIENFSEVTELFSLLFNTDPYYKKGTLEVKQINDRLKSEILDELDILNFLSGTEYVSDFMSDYRENLSGNKTSQKVQGCLISIDHRTGYIEAMVGGSEFSSINQLNRVMQSKRQAGSAIKGLLYSAAIESKMFTPATAILDSPVMYIDREGVDWIPGNYDERYYGLVRLRTALEKSLNVISIKIAERLGLDRILEYYAKLLKLEKTEAKKRIPRNLSIALGSIDVSPFELARAYAIIANGGRDVIPFSIRYIKDRNGEIIDNPESDIRADLKNKSENGSLQIIKADTAQIMISLLRSVMTSGTGLSAAMGRPAGGKTGTSSYHRDAWFVGFTPQLTTCIWAGYDNSSISLGEGQTGGGIVAPIWREYMKQALENEPYLEFPHYASLVSQTVCAISGLLPSPYCKKTVDELFAEDTLPESECNFCEDLKYNIDPLKPTPKENIAGSQRESILENIMENKDSSSILDRIGKDLLE